MPSADKDLVRHYIQAAIGAFGDRLRGNRRGRGKHSLSKEQAVLQTRLHDGIERPDYAKPAPKHSKNKKAIPNPSDYRRIKA
jgi:hypothetical protein